MATEAQLHREVLIKAQTNPEFRRNLNLAEFWARELALEAPIYETNGKSKLSIAILGYKSNSFGTWDPFTTEIGLPGSEECAVYASQELARLGHRVILYLNPKSDSIWTSKFSNPRWLSEEIWGKSDNIDTYDLVLLWRRYDVNTGRKRGKIVFFWPHDSPPIAPPGFSLPPFPQFDGICVLSEHHRKQFSTWPGFNKYPYAVCGNGIVPEHFNAPMQFTNPYSIGYFSNYARGLIILLIIWPDIRKAFPTATLSICYGRETWGTMPPDTFQFVINKITEYKDIGVTEHGKVGHLELALIMQNTSIWAYPCTELGETFCITAVKCQAAGCIPVTTRIAALNETVHPEAPHIEMFRSETDVIKYKDCLLATLKSIQNRDAAEIKKEREKYIIFAQKFSWAACVEKWLALYQRVVPLKDTSQ